ncbi:MAG TPA: acyltransferase [Polyangiaceae bacterium]|nr:acyltransferase [Polyangiaceae bacterium]
MKKTARFLLDAIDRATVTRIRLRSLYWRSQLELRGGSVGPRFIARRGVTISFKSPTPSGPPRERQIKIGANVYFYDDVNIYLGANANLEIGDHVFLGRGAIIAAGLDVVIGRGTQIAHYSTVIDSDHRFGDPERRLGAQGFEFAPVRIGSDVWIGANSVVLKGVTVGDRAVIGAGSVVRRDVPTATVNVGNPARTIRHLFNPSSG